MRVNRQGRELLQKACGIVRLTWPGEDEVCEVMLDVDESDPLELWCFFRRSGSHSRNCVKVFRSSDFVRISSLNLASEIF